MKLAWIAVALVIADLVLLASGYRFLMAETRVEPGENFTVPDWGNLGTASAPQLACRYFTGRGVQWRVFWYAQNNFMGRSECPFLLPKGE